ncbi:MAG: GC-type dockerin domain-anchored protein [Planctomycetota bacterium]
MNLRSAYCVAAMAAMSTAAHAQLSYTHLGTEAPPTEIDGYDLQSAFEIRASGLFYPTFPTAGLLSPRTATWDEALRLERIGDDWPTWSHGYEGAVYTTDLVTDEVEFTFPEGEVGALMFYVQPRRWGTFEFNIQVITARGDIRFINESIRALDAEGFAFSTESGDSITSVRIQNPIALATGFAVGEFSSAPAEVDCGGWQTISFTGPGSPLIVPFTATEDCNRLRITDGYLAGDRFNIRILQGATVVDQFMTSEPEGLGQGIGDDFEAAFVDPNWSSASTVLDPGNYIMQVSVLDSPFGPGDAAFSLVPNGRCGFGQCPADFNGDGSINIFDFLEFQNSFDAQDSCADMDDDGSFTIFDFLAFQNLFDAGC